MKRLPAFLVLLAGLLLIGAACQKEATNTTSGTVNENRNVSGNANLDDEDVNENENANENEDGNVNEDEDEDVNENANENENENVNSDDEEDVVSNGTLSITKPQRNETLDSPFQVKGSASGSVVYVRVKNASGGTLFTETTTVREGRFEINLSVQVTNSTSGTIEVFQKEADGTETNLVSVPVNFVPEEADDTNSNSNGNVNADGGY